MAHGASPADGLAPQLGVHVGVGGLGHGTQPRVKPRHQPQGVALEVPVGGAPLEHPAYVGEAGEGGGPGDVLRLLGEVGGEPQHRVVVQLARLGQVERVVQDLGPVNHVDAGVVLVQLLRNQVPVLLVIIYPEYNM